MIRRLLALVAAAAATLASGFATAQVRPGLPPMFDVAPFGGTSYAFQPETLALEAAKTTPPTTAQLWLDEATIKQLKATPFWNACPAIWFTAAADAQAAKLNWRGPTGAYNLVANGTLIFSPYGGFKSDGSTGYLATGINPVTMPGAAANEGAVVACLLDEQVSDTNVLQATGGGATTALRPRGSTGSQFMQLGTTGYASFKATSSAYLIGASRGAATGYDPSSTYIGYARGQATQLTAPFVSHPTGPLTLLKAGSSFPPNTLGFGAYCTQGVSAATLQQVEAIASNYMFASGAISDDNDTPTPPDSGPNWFDYQGAGKSFPSVTPTGLHVVMPGRPPATDTEANTTYPLYPLDQVRNQDLSGAFGSTWSKGQQYHFQWEMRYAGAPAPFNNKPNPFSPRLLDANQKECRPTYSTIPKAMAATEIMVMKSVGYSDAEIAAVASANGLTVVTYAAIKASPSTYCTGTYDGGSYHYSTTLDLAYLQGTRLVDLPAPQQLGIMLDLEAQDGRLPADELAHLQRLAAYVHAKGFAFSIYTNPIGQGGNAQSGVDASNLPAIYGLVDSISVYVFRGSGDMAAAIDSQVALFGPRTTYAKVMLQVGIGGAGAEITSAQAIAIRQKVQQYQIYGIDFFPARGTFGGPLTRQFNQVIAIILGLPTSDLFNLKLPSAVNDNEPLRRAA